MNPLTFDKAKVLERLNENMVKHVGEYAEARTAYDEKVKEVLEEQLAIAAAGGTVDVNAPRNLPVPQDYSDEYVRVIDQLTMADDKTIVLGPNEFNMWMRDEWQWKPIFAASTQSYL